jgi:Leucine Rich repeat
VTVNPKPLSRPWWSYVRFSIRGLIVLVLLIGAGLGWLVRRAHVQRDAIVAIRRAGGSVLYDWEWNNGKSVPGGIPWASKWLVDLIGIDYFAHVTSVSLRPTPSDSAIVEVGRLTQLERLQLIGGFVSDSELAHLKGLTKLSDLYLSSNHVSDAGLAHLKGLTKLKFLQLGNTRVTDVGLAHLKGQTKLQYLTLGGTQVTDGGLVHVEGLSSLSLLWLGSTQVSDAGLTHLKGSPGSFHLTFKVKLNLPGVAASCRVTPGWRTSKPACSFPGFFVSPLLIFDHDRLASCQRGCFSTRRSPNGDGSGEHAPLAAIASTEPNRRLDPFLRSSGNGWASGNNQDDLPAHAFSRGLCRR